MKILVSTCTSGDSYIHLISQVVEVERKMSLWYHDWYFSPQHPNVAFLAQDCLVIEE